MSVFKSDHEAIADALEHFEKTLINLQDDDEVKIGNSVMKEDLKNHAKNAKDLAVRIRSKNHDLRFVHNLALVCNALTRYSIDLQASRASIKKKLFGESAERAIFDTENLDNEIAHIEKLRSIHCKASPDS